MTNKADLPIIDWAQHSDTGIAEPSTMSKELLGLFLQQLPDLENAIETAFKNSDAEGLKNSLHRFQGACAYCGLPRLRETIAEAGASVRAIKAMSPEQLANIQSEIAHVRAELKKLKLLN